MCKYQRVMEMTVFMSSETRTNNYHHCIILCIGSSNDVYLRYSLLHPSTVPYVPRPLNKREYLNIKAIINKYRRKESENGLIGCFHDSLRWIAETEELG